MKYIIRVFISISLLFITTTLFAQSPGLIVRPAGGPGSSVLNPDGNAWTSATTAGFTTSDITQSEILYKIIPPLFQEPTGDLATGPNGGYSDIVKAVDGSGCYIFNSGTNLMFRLRIGSVVSGAKAYNILIDTDNKLGATGPNADPNYVAPTNSGNGNPGFEIELAFETGSSGRIAVYNVDGIINPSTSFTYTLASNSIISAALSRESNDADYFYDFYVPLSALSTLGLSGATPFRIVTTTNTNPGSAFQGTRSDIYGINDALFPNTTSAWQYVGENTPPIRLSDITVGGGGFTGVCTAAPTVNTGIGAGSSVAITGTWASLDVTRPTPATISVYNNGVLAGTTTCNSGSTWTYTIATVAAGDIITAKAQATGESMCLVSNSVAVTSCTPSNISSNSSLVVTCSTVRGMQGTKLANARIKIYSIAAGGALTLFATDNTSVSPSGFYVTYSDTNTPTGTIWEYNGANNGGANAACSGGAPDLSNTSFAYTITESGKCESAPYFSCLGLTQTALPVITQTAIYPGSSTISGTAAASSTVRLLVNGFIVATTTATAGGAYSFSNPVLQTGDIVTVNAQSAGQCVSTAATLTVTCFTSSPVITTDAQGFLTTGSTTVSGTSTEANGTTIRLYQSPSTLLGTTTVTNKAWSLTVTALTGAQSFYATAQNGSCSISANSASASTRSATTICPTITGTPYADGAASVSGTLPSSFTGTVYLYQDGAQIGSVAVTAATIWTVTIAASNPLYAGGILTVGAQATGNTLNKSCGSTATVTCSVPSTPAISPTSSSIAVGQTVTYTVTTTESGVLYSVQDATSGTSYATSQFGNSSSETFTTNAFSTPGTYTINVTADKLSGSTCKTFSAASVTVTGTLPVYWLSFTARKNEQDISLNWSTANEQNTKDFSVQHSSNGIGWNTIGIVTATGSSSNVSSYSYIHHSPLNGNNYYRLLQTDNDGRSSYSKITSVSVEPSAARFSVYPNPVSNGQLTLQLPNAGLVQVYNGMGVLVLSKQLQSGKQHLDLSRLAKGLYRVQEGNDAVQVIIQ